MWVLVIINHWRTISAIWNNGALRGACGSRHSILKQCAPEFFPTMEQEGKKKRVLTDYRVELSFGKRKE
jgi:hypothetical protein